MKHLNSYQIFFFKKNIIIIYFDFKNKFNLQKRKILEKYQIIIQKNNLRDEHCQTIKETR